MSLARRAASWPVVLVVLLVAVAAGWAVISAVRTDHPPALRLLPSVDGLVLDTSASGQLDRAAAAKVTVVPTSELDAELRRDDFSKGEVRTFRQGDAFVEVAGFSFRHASGAVAFQKYVLEYAAQLPGGGVHAGSAAFFDVPGSPSLKGFQANGEQAADGSPLFLQGVWFTRGRQVFLVEAGSSAPSSSDLVSSLAKEQLARVGP